MIKSAFPHQLFLAAALFALIETREVENEKFYGANFEGFRLEGWCFTNCSFGGADFYMAEIRSCTFRECDLYLAQFQRATVLRTMFDRTNLNRAAFNHANLTSSSFYRLNARCANFSGADLSHCLFASVSMRHCYFHDAVIERIRFKEVDIAASSGILAIGPGGREGRITYVIMGVKNKTRIMTGCFWGTPEQLLESMKQNLNPNGASWMYYEKIVLPAVAAFEEVERLKSSMTYSEIQEGGGSG